MLIIFGIIIFLFILATSIKYGNPEYEVQKKHWKQFVTQVAYDINKLVKKGN